MKILLVSLFLPHPRATHAGGRFVYDLLCHLAEKHDVDLVTRHELEEAGTLTELEPLCRRIYPYPYATAAKRGLADKLGLAASYFGFSRFADRLIATGDYDLVQVEWVEAALLIRRHKTPMVLDAHDVISKPAERAMASASGLVAKLFSLLRHVMVSTIESLISRRFSVVLTRSEFDQAILQRLVPEVQSAVIPHPAGLDLSDTPRTPQGKSILFLASFKYRPVNVTAALWFYRQVFPQVVAALPDARFVIAGYGPPPELVSLADDSRVAVTGFVEDIDRCYKEAAVFVAPILTGGGIIVKVLDALSSGTPTVSTSYGNEGIGAAPGRDILIADDPDDFAAAVVKLLRDREFADRLGRNGQQFVAAHYSRAAVMTRLDAVHAETVSGRRGER